MTLRMPAVLVVPILMAALSCPGRAQAPAICSLGQLASLPWCELEQLYRQATPGHLPCGFVRGRVVYPPCEPHGQAKACVAKLFWRGKHFDNCANTLINQWLGAKAIRAQIYPGPSWLDGQPAHILDYAETSRVWADARDEMREVAPGFYVGAMYIRGCPEPHVKLFFLLEAEHGCH